MNYPDTLKVNDNNKILCVGMLCLDVVSVCDDFPIEDSNQICKNLLWQKGGNAANTSAVLGLLNQNVEYMGTIAESEQATQNLLCQFVKNEMKSYNVCMDHIVTKKNHQTPCSQVIINLKNGSRTIVHSRNFLPEITVDNFTGIDLSKYSLIHFEGRNINEVFKILKLIENYNETAQPDSKVLVSFEAEKPRKQEMLSLMKLVDIVVISQVFAEFYKHKNAVDSVKGFKQYCKPGTFIVCCWGSSGAAHGIVGNNDEVMISAFVPDRVVDTLGAGDTFNGALICSLNQRKTLAQSVEYACQVAGHKVSAHGYKHIRKFKF